MLTASIVVYKNGENELIKAIQSLICDSIYTIYIVDNSPTDNLRELVVAISSKIEYIFGHGNVGYGSAHNIAIRKAISNGSKYHIVMNPDVCFSQGVIESLTLYMDSHADVGQIMPKVIYPNGDLQYLCKLLPTPRDILFRRFFPKGFHEKWSNRFHLKFSNYDIPMNVPCLSGCFMFLRIEILEKVGIFDERFFLYFEDNDLCRRIHGECKTMMYPYLEIVHTYGSSHRHNIKIFAISVINAIKYFNKWGWIFDKTRRQFNDRFFVDYYGEKKSAHN